jgi:dephospho-CoA kinase
MVIGITGKYCAGKNEAARVFQEAGYPVIDVDRLGHEALSARRDMIVQRFGENILAPNGEIDRKRLGSIVFRRGERLKALEDIVHPYMRGRISDIIGSPGNRTGNSAVINAALLFRMGLNALCARIIIVEAPFMDRINRALERDDISVLEVFRRMRAQRKLIPQPSLLPADTIIVENSGTQGALREKIIRIIPRLAG